MVPQAEFILTCHMIRFCLALYSFAMQFLDLLRQSLFRKKKKVLLTETSLRILQCEITMTSRGPSIMSYVRHVLYIYVDKLYFLKEPKI